MEDVLFFDTWKPPAYLVATANPDSAQKFRQLLKEHRTAANFLGVLFENKTRGVDIC
jgi:hydrogenase maturation factor